MHISGVWYLQIRYDSEAQNIALLDWDNPGEDRVIFGARYRI